MHDSTSGCRRRVKGRRSTCECEEEARQRPVFQIKICGTQQVKSKHLALYYHERNVSFYIILKEVNFEWFSALTEQQRVFWKRFAE